MTNTFEDRLRESFTDSGLPEIAKMLGVNYHTLRNWAKERNDIPRATLIKIADSTNISLNWLLTGRGEKYSNPQQRIGLEEMFEVRMREIARDEVKSVLAARDEIGPLEMTERIRPKEIEISEEFNSKEGVRRKVG